MDGSVSGGSVVMDSVSGGSVATGFPVAVTVSLLVAVPVDVFFLGVVVGFLVMVAFSVITGWVGVDFGASVGSVVCSVSAGSVSAPTGIRITSFPCSSTTSSSGSHTCVSRLQPDKSNAASSTTIVLLILLTNPPEAPHAWGGYGKSHGQCRGTRSHRCICEASSRVFHGRRTSRSCAASFPSSGTWHFSHRRIP